ncbi:MAG TPA: hypothetical protein VK764_04745 [Terracidiphilus sp.]|jgi:hypothetical protein|nr:hypothetical protein [Terracidiphilus sp.]
MNAGIEDAVSGFSMPQMPAELDPEKPSRRLRDGARLIESLCDAGRFLKAFRVKLRFGELTRSPLRLLRLQVTETEVQCDVLARRADSWDAGLPGEVARRNEARQALTDAIEVRALLFKTLPGLDRGELRIYRETQSGRELIAAGRVERRDRVARSVRSLAMRAKLLGFQFAYEDEVLMRMTPETFSGGSLTSAA